MIQLGTKTVPSLEAFEALRAVGQLFLRNRSMKMIQASGPKWGAVAANLSESAMQTQAIEHLDVADRAVLVPAAYKVLEEWPDSFLAFCEEASITRVHFNGATLLQPDWMTALVDQRLAKQNRFVTPATIAAAIDHFREEKGYVPAVTELRAHMQWQGEKGLADFYPPKRMEATFDEWRRFLASCIEFLDHAAQGSLRYRMTASNHLIGILLDLLVAHGMHYPADPSKQAMILALQAGRKTRVREGTTVALLIDRLLASTSAEAEITKRELAKERRSKRQTCKWFRMVTAQLPATLERDVCVFLKAASFDGLYVQTPPSKLPESKGCRPAPSQQDSRASG